MTRHEANRMAKAMFEALSLKDWTIEWSPAAPSECWEESRKLMMWEGLLENPWWYVKEQLIHELAHIGTGVPTDLAETRHGPRFFRRLGRIAIKFAELSPQDRTSARGTRRKIAREH